MGESNLPEQVLTTTTGELMQLVRLHYDLFNQKEMLRIFKKLGCIDFDPARRRWAWVYAREASSLKFKRSYNDLPKEARRIVLGSFFITSETKMHLDLRSVERALAAVEFFDQRVPRVVAKLRYLCIVNRLFSDPKELPEDFDFFFDREEARHFDPAAAQAAMIEDVLKGVKRQTPEMECVPTNYYEDGISQMKLVLFARQTVASKHFLGETEYSFEDYVRELVKAKPKPEE
ncbi:MAG: hypothetical protein L0Y75_08890 [Acidobacteria bacterium]|nr:hypothetical protein [Acidobacteriota bacterium]